MHSRANAFGALFLLGFAVLGASESSELKGGISIRLCGPDATLVGSNNSLNEGASSLNTVCACHKRCIPPQQASDRCFLLGRGHGKGPGHARMFGFRPSLCPGCACSNSSWPAGDRATGPDTSIGATGTGSLASASSVDPADVRAIDAVITWVDTTSPTCVHQAPSALFHSHSRQTAVKQPP